MRTVSDMLAFAVTDGMLHFELTATYEIFTAPQLDYEVMFCGNASVRVGRFTLEPDLPLDRLDRAETVVVPAIEDVDEPLDLELVQAVRAAYDKGARIVSLCTGAFVLAEAGLLDGLRATTHWGHTDELARRYPRVEVDPDVLYVDNGQVLTSAGKAAAIDLSLHVIRNDYGAATANTAARRLVVPPHRDGGQAQFVLAPVPSGEGHPLTELFDWVSARFDQMITVEDMARQASMSSRHLARLFRAVTGTTPLQWLHTQRIRRAQELLEMTDDSVDQIAEASGMGTATTLRRHFHRTVGVPPDTYRRTFRPVGGK
ncbi:Transcriptional regulator GlxA family, contains an amidase domain and an AraC-type DNA-binding HTH domain [Lentzea waywayandensis]|uniref:Transcriptional regulator GlxA family, contains an amidase domain and an AraC-type DNA-binding HTH domain n=1 Tax=Lentzea waywayandensis TaxID=84724 RepID=A0A1I6EWL1_9PSEU|nr:helix-turn-helix domain-containing protein [Lentzea waywayandensis]SFR22090.1 Transcriptional regulator GlxA family, contains an amidase domain and an AraC-type DNA-binding HTH domain [Lentzea waywayandensis]